MTWESLYNLLGIKDLIYFISSPELQDYLFPVKLFFVCATLFFFSAVVYFMLNSSWLQYKFLEEVTEFFSWKSLGLKEISKKWTKIRKLVESGTDADYKLAIIEADDFLSEVLDQNGFEGDSFEDLIKKANKFLSAIEPEILAAHETRNSIVYNPDFKLMPEHAKKILNVYEAAVNSVGLG